MSKNYNSYTEYLGSRRCCDSKSGIPGPIGPRGLSGYTGYTGPTGPTGDKTFIIDHPNDTARYLVHGCLEGPEVGVYYRGISEITDNDSVIIYLPSYVSGWATDFTIYVTPIYDGKIKNYASSNVETNGTFKVYGENGKFNWIAMGKRRSLNAEPLKTEIGVKGFGPYKWIE